MSRCSAVEVCTGCAATLRRRWSLVFEATPPSTLRALYEADAETPDPDRSTLSFAHADVGHPVHLSDYLNSAWGDLRVEELHEGQSTRFDADEFEYAIYVLAGKGRVALPDGGERIGSGTAVVFTRWTRASWSPPTGRCVTS